MTLDAAEDADDVTLVLDPAADEVGCEELDPEAAVDEADDPPPTDVLRFVGIALAGLPPPPDRNFGTCVWFGPGDGRG
jgi:hypothetical protein